MIHYYLLILYITIILLLYIIFITYFIFLENTITIISLLFYILLLYIFYISILYYHTLYYFIFLLISRKTVNTLHLQNRHTRKIKRKGRKGVYNDVYVYRCKMNDFQLKQIAPINPSMIITEFYLFTERDC